MSEMDTVRALAREALTIPSLSNESDNSYWDRAERFARNTGHICRLAGLAESGQPIDHFCLMAAAYFSEAGVVWRSDGKHAAAGRAFSDGNGMDLLDLAAEIAAAKLTDVLDGGKIEKIVRIIRESGDRFTSMTEAMVLSDARNLDDVGAVGIFNESRRHAISGRGACDAVQDWKNKIDYQYWQARLKRSFRFEQVRKLAERRLSAAESFMSQLKLETEGLDLEELAVEPPAAK